MKYTSIAGAILFLVLIFIVGTIIYSQNTKSITTPSSLILNPSPTAVLGKTQDPVVTSWKSYQNTKYNFSLSYPEGWNTQEYTNDSGTFQVAFSPNSLPCSTCSYVHDGYFSIKIFNQQTDPQDFATYSSRKQNIGKVKSLIPVQLAGKSGIMDSSIIDVENRGMIFELLLDKDNGADKVTDSQIFQKAALSLQFTDLIFNN